ncbi:hypothetical protein C8J56DRAFT_1042310 [Mycena floridula]|nr:hypothetical protein C8J56DRAFT_1042310 [Mycena floridula]
MFRAVCALLVIFCHFWLDTRATLVLNVPENLQVGATFVCDWVAASTDPPSFLLGFDLNGNAKPVGVVTLPRNGQNEGTATLYAPDTVGTYLFGAAEEETPFKLLATATIQVVNSEPASTSTTLPDTATDVRSLPNSESQHSSTFDNTSSPTKTPGAPDLGLTSGTDTQPSSDIQTGLVPDTLPITGSATATSTRSIPIVSSQSSSLGTVTAIPAGPPADVKKPRNETGIIVGITLATMIIFVLLLILAFRLSRRRRQKHSLQSLDPLIINDVMPARTIPRIREEKVTVESTTQASGQVESTSATDLGSSRQDRPSSSGVELPVEALVEIERLRLENQILRRQFVPESPEEPTLPPSYPGSIHSSRTLTVNAVLRMPLDVWHEVASPA